MFKKSFVLLAVCALYACSNGSGSNSKDNLSAHQCSTEADGIKGCWVSEFCAVSESGESSNTIIIDVSEKTYSRFSPIYANNKCSENPEKIIQFENDINEYEFDSKVTSSEGLETDLYLFIGYTLISIENDRMCFSKGVYDTADGHSFNFGGKEEVSLEVDFEHCFKRIN